MEQELRSGRLNQETVDRQQRDPEPAPRRAAERGEARLLPAADLAARRGRRAVLARRALGRTLASRAPRCRRSSRAAATIRSRRATAPRWTSTSSRFWKERRDEARRLAVAAGLCVGNRRGTGASGSRRRTAQARRPGARRSTSTVRDLSAIPAILPPTRWGPAPTLAAKEAFYDGDSRLRGRRARGSSPRTRGI